MIPNYFVNNLKGVFVVVLVLSLSTIAFAEKPVYTVITSDDDSSDTVKYDIQIDNNSDFSSPLEESISSLEDPGRKTYNAAIDLSPSTYYWRSKSIDSHGAQSDWSTTRSFTINASDTSAPSTPSTFTIRVADKQAKINWTNPANSDFAQVKIYRQQGGANNNSNTIDVTETKSTTAVGALVENLQNNIEYTFWLKAVDTSGNESTATDKLTVLPGAERIYATAGSLTPSITITSSSQTTSQNIEFSGSVIGQGIASANKAPLVFLKDNKVQFALVDQSAHLSTIAKIADVESDLTSDKIASLPPKMLAAPTPDKKWRVIYSNGNSLYFVSSTDASGSQFNTPELIASDVSPWEIELLENESPIVATLSSDRKQIVVYKQTAGFWSSQLLTQSTRPISGFDIEKINNEYVLAYETSQTESKNILGSIVNAFRTDNIVVVKVNGKEQVLSKGKKSTVPVLAIDPRGKPYVIVWNTEDNAGLEYYSYDSNKWEKEGTFAQNNATFGYQGKAPVSGFWDNANGLTAVWNTNADNPTTYFGFGGKVYRSLNAQTTSITPKITKFGANRFVYIIGSSGFIYEK